MNVLFQEQLKREQLLALPPAPVDRTITIAVHRNHSFELVASVLGPFLGLARVKATFLYSEYDDSLAVTAAPPHADIHLLWLDAARYTIQDFPAWLTERIRALQGQSTGKVLVACLGGPNLAGLSLPDVLVVSPDALLAPLGEAALNPRLEAYTGTRLSNEACLLLARELGARFIPALLFPPLKALVVDLDNTLYAGVLGEDGPHGVVPYTKVQERLAELARQGFLLALASKNEEEDVRALFALRPDFPLRWEDFAATAVTWQPKTQTLERIAAELRIGLDSLLFIDDNPGERLQVAHSLPGVHILEADSPEATLAGLRYYPGLFKTAVHAEDALRSRDLKANTQREALQQKLTPEAYLRELAITLTFAVNPQEHSTRIAELLHKTNQFIVACKRPSQNELAQYFTDADRCVVTASLADKLSDSGLIAVVLAAKSGTTLCLEEIAISCRALGRGLEGGMLHHMLHLAAKSLHAGPPYSFRYVTAPRNKPALAWLHSLAPASLGESGTLVLPALPPASLAGVRVEHA